jgi:hypothetical protein
MQSFTLREEYQLQVFENRVLRKINRPKKGNVTGEHKISGKEELCEVKLLIGCFHFPFHS